MKKSAIILTFALFTIMESYAQDVDVRGGLSITVGPAPTEIKKEVAELFITDPSGRQAGLDISTGEILQEIPNASYGKERIDDLETGELGEVGGTLESVTPSDGIYKLAVIGNNSGKYSLDIFAYDINDNPSVQKLESTTYPGKIDNYEITYSSAPGSQVKVKFVGSSEIHEVSCATKIHPHHWNLNWYNWVKEHMGEREWIAQFAERVSILCVIGNLKDNQGNPHSVDEISPETLVLNNVLPPQPWKFKREERIAIILKSGEDQHLRTRKGFREWHRVSRFFKDYQGPVMLVKFNKFMAMETMPEMIPGKEYGVTVSGELKDGKPFKGSAKVTITEWKATHGWKWHHPGWLNSDNDMDQWWNKEKDLEGWWEKIRKQHKPKPKTGSKGYRQ